MLHHPHRHHSRVGWSSHEVKHLFLAIKHLFRVQKASLARDLVHVLEIVGGVEVDVRVWVAVVVHIAVKIGLIVKIGSVVVEVGHAVDVVAMVSHINAAAVAGHVVVWKVATSPLRSKFVVHHVLLATLVVFVVSSVVRGSSIPSSAKSTI